MVGLQALDVYAHHFGSRAEVLDGHQQEADMKESLGCCWIALARHHYLQVRGIHLRMYPMSVCTKVAKGCGQARVMSEGPCQGS